MATRVDGSPGPMPPMIGSDNRSDQRREQMIKELTEREVVRTRNEATHVVDQVLRRMQPDGGGLKVAPLNPDGTQMGEKKPDDKNPQRDLKPKERRDVTQPRTDGRQDSRTDAANQRPRVEAPPQKQEANNNTRARPEDVPRALADFQRQQGLPVTGRLDAATLQQLKDTGLITTQQGAEPTQQKQQVSQQDQNAARKLSIAGEKPVKDRAEKNEPGFRPHDRVPKADQVADPARLIASLVTAGFLGKKGALEDGIKAFQAMFGLPLSGKLDQQTQEALKKQGMLEHDGPPPQASSSTEQQKAQNVKRALNEPIKATVADKNIERDTTRAQASTKQPTTTNDVAARAPNNATPDAMPQPQDKMRLDTVMAQQQAVERGVQEGKGDPAASAGQGASEGQGQGVQGSGGASGGGQGTTGTGAIGAEGPAGDETAVGNSKAGDDDFVDESRGHAVVATGVDPDEEVPEGHYEVPPLSEQVAFALAAIARDDDGSGPVTYTWDVTFYRPGVYAPGQPAEEIWHVVVAKATAFDPVWQQACDAIGSKMLYMEPDATPPVIDDFVVALKKARVA